MRLRGEYLFKQKNTKRFTSTFSLMGNPDILLTMLKETIAMLNLGSI
jgi:hypothetical protein